MHQLIPRYAVADANIIANETTNINGENFPSVSFSQQLPRMSPLHRLITAMVNGELWKWSAPTMSTPFHLQVLSVWTDLLLLVEGHANSLFCEDITQRLPFLGDCSWLSVTAKRGVAGCGRQTESVSLFWVFEMAQRRHSDRSRKNGDLANKTNDWRM